MRCFSGKFCESYVLHSEGVRYKLDKKEVGRKESGNLQEIHGVIDQTAPSGTNS